MFSKIEIFGGLKNISCKVNWKVNDYLQLCDVKEEREGGMTSKGQQDIF